MAKGESRGAGFGLRVEWWSGGVVEETPASATSQVSRVGQRGANKRGRRSACRVRHREELKLAAKAAKPTKYDSLITRHLSKYIRIGRWLRLRTGDSISFRYELCVQIQRCISAPLQPTTVEYSLSLLPSRPTFHRLGR